mgnify:CR=1 FL=1
MHATHHAASPFGMLTDPEATLRTIEAMQHSSNCRGRICRPLDRVQIPREASPESGAFDAEVESSDAADDDAI